jgi:cell division protein FtsB
MSAPGDRYDPLPGVLQIPGHLIRKLSPRGRRILAIAAGVLAVATAVALVLAIPAIDDSKSDRAAAQQRAEEQRLAERTAQLRAEMRLLQGRGTAVRGLEGAAAVNARRALAAEVAAAVERDASTRVQSGELENPVLGVECERYPRGARGENPATDLSSPTGRYACLAVTAEVPASRYSEGSSVGYPYRALVDFPAGEFTYCKVSGKPGEGSLTREFPVQVPRACGGGA